MKRRFNFLHSIILRYSVLILLGIVSVSVFYPFFIPLTLYPTYFLLSLFFNPSLVENVIFVGNFPIEIIGACVAGSAYYLMLILNLSTPGIKLSRRIGAILFSFVSFLLINILRIFSLSFLLLSGKSSFDIIHKFLWYFGSVLFVVLIWFLTVKIFQIKEIPIYSDVISLLKSKKKVKKTRHSKRH